MRRLSRRINSRRCLRLFLRMLGIGRLFCSQAYGDLGEIVVEQSALITIKSPLRHRANPVELPGGARGSWFSQQRLRFIEARLFWHGRVNRSDLVDHFAIHRSVASEDLAEYRRVAPRNAVYDRRSKAYRAGRGFLPIFGPPAMAGLLAHGLLNDGLPSPQISFETVSVPERAADPVVARNIIAAAQEGFALKVFYRSMDTPAGRWRWIEPHSLVSDGFRWHVRAYCRERGEFRDFVLGRMERADETGPRLTPPESDSHWVQLIHIAIRPHHLLTPEQAELVAIDYGMSNGQALFSCRRALLWYALINLGLEEERSPPRQLLELADPEIRTMVGFR